MPARCARMGHPRCRYEPLADRRAAPAAISSCGEIDGAIGEVDARLDAVEGLSIRRAFGDVERGAAARAVDGARYPRVSVEHSGERHVGLAGQCQQVARIRIADRGGGRERFEGFRLPVAQPGGGRKLCLQRPARKRSIAHVRSGFRGIQVEHQGVEGAVSTENWSPPNGPTMRGAVQFACDRGSQDGRSALLKRHGQCLRRGHQIVQIVRYHAHLDPTAERTG